MKIVIMYLLGKKGLSALQGVIDSKNSNLIQNVVVGHDSSINNDYSDDIIKLCQRNKIKYTLRRNFKPKHQDSKLIIAIAIGWRWLINENITLL